MNSSVVLLGIAMIYTVSHLWFRSAVWLSILVLLWGLFFGSLILTADTTGTIYRTLLESAVWVFVFCLFNAFFIMKFVTGPPLWKPIAYEDFKQLVGKNSEKGKYLFLVNAFLVISLACLVLVAVDEAIN